MSQRFSVGIIKEGKWYVAQALELGIMSQGRTVPEATRNLQEAVALYLEDLPVAETGEMVTTEAPLFTTIEV